MVRQELPHMDVITALRKKFPEADYYTEIGPAADNEKDKYTLGWRGIKDNETELRTNLPGGEAWKVAMLGDAESNDKTEQDRLRAAKESLSEVGGAT